MTVEDVLGRRIEELLAYDEEPAATAQEVRVEVGAARSDFVRLRTDLEGLVRGLVASVSAARAETGALTLRVAELTGRLDGVGSGVEEVRGLVPALTRELRDGLDLLPVRTQAASEAVAARLSEQVSRHVDVVGDDVRAAVETALESGARSTGAAVAAMVDVQAAVDSRLALLEQVLPRQAEDVVERLWALVESGLRGVEDRLLARSEALREELLGQLDRVADDDAQRYTALEGSTAGVAATVTAGLAALRADVGHLLAQVREEVVGAVQDLGADVLERVEEQHAERVRADGAQAAAEVAMTHGVLEALRAQADATHAELVATRAELQAAHGELSAARSEVGDGARALADLREQLEDGSARADEADDALVRHLQEQEDVLRALLEPEPEPELPPRPRARGAAAADRPAGGGRSAAATDRSGAPAAERVARPAVARRATGRPTRTVEDPRLRRQ